MSVSDTPSRSSSDASSVNVREVPVATSFTSPQNSSSRSLTRTM
jgi:hypothetical protein